MDTRCGGEAVTKDTGFVLVGVVMFVLALTILGLSLFSLSSYEGQFSIRSQESNQALFAAQGGIEHAKFVLAKSKVLSQVAAPPIFPNSVVYLRAKRMDNGDTLGSIASLPPGTPVEIRVLANVSGQRRMVQAQYVPNQTPNLYKRLMTISDSMHVKDHEGSFYLCPQTHFYGDVHEGGKSLEPWWNCVTAVTSYQSPAPNLPTPDVPSFLGTYVNDPATQEVTVNAGTASYSLTSTAAPNRAAYFRSLNDPYGPDPYYSVHVPNTKSADIWVSGWVVWMVPKGMLFENKAVVHGTPNDCLVIVAGPSTDTVDPNLGRRGIWFKASFDSYNVPVILVSNSWVQDEHTNLGVGCQVSYLSIFARCGWFAGPKAGKFMDLFHDTNPNNVYDAPGGLIDKLCDIGALPNSETGSTKYTSVAGTWQELDPDNPPYP